MSYWFEGIVANTMRPKPNGYETISVTNAAVKDLTVPADSFRAVLVGTYDIRVLFGADPTTSVGFLVEAGTIFELQSAEELAAFRMIAPSTTSVVTVLYSK